MSAQAFEAAQQNILKWCEEEGFTVDQKPLEGVDFACQVYVHDKPELRVTVARSTGDSKLIAATGVRFDDTMRSRLVALGPEGTASVMQDLAWLVNSHPVSFQLNRDGNLPSSVLIAKPIYDDGLTKSSLMSAIAELQRMRTLVMLQLERSLQRQGESAHPSPKGCPNCGSPLKAGAAFCSKCGARLGHL